MSSFLDPLKISQWLSKTPWSPYPLSKLASKLWTSGGVEQALVRKNDLISGMRLAADTSGPFVERP